MGRAEERRKTKDAAKASKTLNMTVAAFEKSLQTARDLERSKALDFAVKHYTTALAIVLRDKWGFGRKRLKRILLQIADMYDSICEGYVSDTEIRATIFDETGIDLNNKISEDCQTQKP